jgi:hypothetical protein
MTGKEISNYRLSLPFCSFDGEERPSGCWNPEGLFPLRRRASSRLSSFAVPRL